MNPALSKMSGLHILAGFIACLSLQLAFTLGFVSSINLQAACAGVLLHSLPKALFCLQGKILQIRHSSPKKFCHGFYRAILIKWLVSIIGFTCVFKKFSGQAFYVILAFCAMTLVSDFLLVSRVNS